MGERNSDLAADYFVGVKREGFSWAWEIHRRSRPLGVRLVEGSFRTEQAARLAGEKALRDFLERLSADERG
jgi:hypothetical protein